MARPRCARCQRPATWFISVRQVCRHGEVRLARCTSGVGGRLAEWRESPSVQSISLDLDECNPGLDKKCMLLRVRSVHARLRSSSSQICRIQSRGDDCGAGIPALAVGIGTGSYGWRRKSVIAAVKVQASSFWNLVAVSSRASAEFRMLPHSIRILGSVARLRPARSSRNMTPLWP